jgi:hypothetical protein
MSETIEDLLASNDVIVIGNKAPGFEGILGRIQPEQSVVLLVRIGVADGTPGTHRGIAW